MNAEVKLLECPFYDKEHQGMAEPYFDKSTDEFHGELWQVRCGYCDASGPVTETEQEALKAWNLRSSVPISRLEAIETQMRSRGGGETEYYFSECADLVAALISEVKRG